MGYTSSGQVENSGSGTIAVLSGAVTISVPAASSLVLTVTGTWVATLAVEASVDGVTYFSVPMVSLPTQASVTTTTANGQFGVPVGGYQQLRIRASAYTSGTATVTWNADSTVNGSLISTPLQGNDAVAAGQVYTVSTTLNMAIGGTQNPLVLLRNPAGSGKVLRILRITAGCTASNVQTTFRLHSGVTITLGGITITPVTTNVGSGAVAVALASTLPTLSVLGNLMMGTHAGQNSQSMDLTKGYEVYLQVNNNLLISGEPVSNNREAVVTVVWAEV